ncbi:acetyl-CoA carboxylase carboxyltransferase subunit alpha/beta [Saccharothrix australiensis]|uniref:Multifunctional fusion protein n=1 Tax=Saccharothrix australiensis TaxID=2072 RepID=A0A495W1C7_9PSEU|nr:acetyl-CoA carboxylase carboxyltransferase subunit alpha/beta [Saccharothrix australiensis]RKT54515.1 acetyl-CoA carboxylase carboxyl transferase subunit beta [Saccharothrix australiensis]
MRLDDLSDTGTAPAGGDPTATPGVGPRRVLDRIDEVPPGVWQRCAACGCLLHHTAWARSHGACAACGSTRRLSAAERIAQLVDPDTFTEHLARLRSTDPLGFTDSAPYPVRLRRAHARTDSSEAAVLGTAMAGGRSVVLLVMDFGFLGGSMGVVVGAKVVAAADLAIDLGAPLVAVSCSGGARMQEGMYSLLQVARAADAVRRLNEHGVPFVSVLTDPVYGGVAASFASLGDVVLAEAGSRSGFAGPRVIEQALGERLPADFQTAEFLHAHGHVDRVVERSALPEVLDRVLTCLAGRRRPGSTARARPRDRLALSAFPALPELPGLPGLPGERSPGEARETDEVRETDERGGASATGEVGEVDGSGGASGAGGADRAEEANRVSAADRTGGASRAGEAAEATGVGGSTAWDAVRAARDPRRPTVFDHVAGIFDDFVELHGDRHTEDDPALVGGLARWGATGVVVLGHAKEHDPARARVRNFGMPHPSGFRKAVRLMRLAGRLGLPVVSFVDTPGAYAGRRAEEGNQSGAIAEALRTASGLPVPLVAVVIGEGGSGGALALAAGDVLLAMRNTYFSVISPEGCAAILHGDAGRAPESAEALRLRAVDLHRAGLVDELVPEPDGGAQADPAAAVRLVGSALRRRLAELARLSTAELLARRDHRLRVRGASADAVRADE